jgi:hypothetical protein
MLTKPVVEREMNLAIAEMEELDRHHWQGGAHPTGKPGCLIFDMPRR